MSINAAITHRTTYRYDKRITLGPQVIRLRPAPHSRTRILSFSQSITPEEHFLNWQQDPFGNWLARAVFPEKVDHFEVTVDLIADMAAVNPFDFFLEEHAQSFPFAYGAELEHDLTPYFELQKSYGELFEAFLKTLPKKDESTIDWLVAINQAVWKAVNYTIRMEPGVQTPEETLKLALGSCRDSAWLMVHLMRRMGVAARFVSGYLLQLTPDIKAVDGPSGPEADFTDLHAWCEVYAPGAGWIGLDPTSGLFAAEGHIPLAATPNPSSAAPITGGHEPAEVSFSHHMEIRRVREEPRITLPFTDDEWALIDAAGHAVDGHLAAGDVRLTMGGEPTFVSASDRDADEWNTGAVGPTKRHYADRLMRRLRDAFAPGGVLHYGQGKWYPGEQLPRWAFGLYWRVDGYPLWENPELIAPEAPQAATVDDAQRLADALTEALELPANTAEPAYEDPAFYMFLEGRLPLDLDPEDNNLDDPLERRQMAQAFDRGLTTPTCVVLPCQLAQSRAHAARGPRRRYRWSTEKWKTRRGRLFLAPGDASGGYRLPLTSLPFLAEGDYPFLHQMDPFAERGPLAPPGSYLYQSQGAATGPAGTPDEPQPQGLKPPLPAPPNRRGAGLPSGPVLAAVSADPLRAIVVENVRTAITV
ncbi:MAG: transglutaminase family protein, partial [Pseudomonadota bacterium]